MQILNLTCIQYYLIMYLDCVTMPPVQICLACKFVFCWDNRLFQRSMYTSQGYSFVDSFTFTIRPLAGFKGHKKEDKTTFSLKYSYYFSLIVVYVHQCIVYVLGHERFAILTRVNSFLSSVCLAHFCTYTFDISESQQ